MADFLAYIWGLIKPLLGWGSDAYSSNSEMVMKGVATLIIVVIFTVVAKKIVGSITELMTKYWAIVAIAAIIAGVAIFTR